MKIDKIAEILNLENHDGIFYGERKGYVLQLDMVQNGYVPIVVCHIMIDKLISKNEINEIKTEIGQKFFIDKVEGVNFITINLSNLYGKPKQEKVNQTIEQIDKVLETLKTKEILPASKCMMCSEEKEDELEYAFRSWSNYPCVIGLAHSSCLEESRNMKIAELEKNNQNVGKLPISILLSAIFTFGVTLIILMIAIFAGYWLGILFALIPIAGYYGYKLGKAPMKKYSAYIVLCESVICTALMILITIQLVSVGGDISFGAATKEMISDIVYCAIFLGLGLFFNASKLFNTNEKQMKDLGK